MCACEKYGNLFLKLRGLCPESNIDKFWVPDMETSLFMLRGITGAEIRFFREKNRWQLTVFGRKEDTVATTSSSYHSFVMGKSQWSIVNDIKGFQLN